MTNYIPFAALLFAALSISTQASSAKSSILFPKSASAIKIIQSGKEILIVTAGDVLRCKGDNITTAYVEADGIQDAALQGNTLFLATRKGLKRLNVHAGFKPLSTQFAGQEIGCLALDDKNRLWVGNTFQGAYLQRGTDSFDLKLQIPSILSMAASADTNVWVGTNVGMYRVGTGNFSTTRYAEEGYAGYELPDNIVEHLFADELTNVWVVMPDNISFKKGTAFAGEMPTFEFLGDKGNAIHSIVAVRNAWYLFITANGISYMPIHALQDEHQHATEEVHEAHNMQARQATAKMLHCPAGWESEPVTGAQKAGANVWFFTAKGCWKVSEKKLIRYLEG